MRDRRALVLLAEYRSSCAGADRTALSPGDVAGARRRVAVAPFIGAVGLFVLSYLGIAISLWPMIVPYHFTLGRPRPRRARRPSCWSARCFLLPVILIYSGWSYWVFRGKVRADIGYH